MTQRRHYKWGVMLSNRKGNNAKIELFQSRKHAMAYVSSLSMKDLIRLCCPPFRLSVLLPAAKP
jgi:hypothetical protein